MKLSIESAQTELREVLPDKAARWTRREQFHLTLRFLGNVETSRADELVSVSQEVCRHFAPLDLTARGMGFFPDARFPRVLWVGVKDPAGQLKNVWQAIQTVTQPFTQEAPEVRFVGHITVARLNRLRRPEVENLADAVEKLQNHVFGQWTANQLQLMRSELSPQGARHTLLAELPFVGK